LFNFKINIMECRIFTTITMIFVLTITVGAQSFERQWDQSNATESRPEWFTGFTNRGIASTPEFVFVASRSPDLSADKKTVMYMNPKTGEFLGTLNVDPIVLGTFAVNDVATSDDGQILVSNLALYHEQWVPEGTWQFKVYKWTNVSAVPEVFIDYDNPEHLRLGDLITVKGDLTANAVIYAAVYQAPKAVRWEVVDGVLNETPEIIELQGIVEENAALGFPKVIPTGVTKNDPFYYNATKTALKKFSADGGTILEEIDPANFLPSNGVEGRDNSFTHFMVGDQSYIAALSIKGTGTSSPAEVKAVNVTNGLNLAMDPFYSASLGTANNEQLNGDISSTVIDGEVWVFLLYSQSGFAAFKYIAPLPEVVVPVTESGWRRGSNPELDSIDGRISRPDWLSENSRAVAVGNGHIYVVNCAPGKGPGEILVLDATDGSYLNKKLDVAAVNAANPTSDLRISDVEVDDAGHILACNMRQGDAFNVFAWDDEDSEPYLLVSASEIPYTDAGDEGVWQQTAYYFDVKGDIKGDAVIVAARSNLAITYRWVITGGVVQNEGVPTVVVNDVPGSTGHFGPYASVALESAAPDSPVWGSGLSINPFRLAADGTFLGAIPDEVAVSPTGYSDAAKERTLVTKYFEWGEKKYLYVYSWHWADHCRLIDVSGEDPSALTLENQQEIGDYLGQIDHPFRWGDVDYFIAEDGSLNLVTLVSSNGIRLDRIEATGTLAKELKKNELRIYPNPTKKFLNIKHSGGVSKVEIINMAGIVVKTFTNLDQERVDVSMLNSGVYFVKVASKEKTISVSKFMKH